VTATRADQHLLPMAP